MHWYYDFFNRFRSPPDTVKLHQMGFVKYFEGCRNVLDIGCGRGEFLELLEAHNIGCHGVDIDREMADHCRSEGLNVEQADAITHLTSINDGSLDGIFTDDTVEHLDVRYMMDMLDLSYQKLADGRYMVIKTVNPLSWVTFSHIYFLDVIHKKAIHPATMQYFLEISGFKDIGIEFVTPMPRDEQLQKMEPEPGMKEDEKRRIAIYNLNIDRLNDALFGPENYVAIAKK